MLVSVSHPMSISLVIEYVVPASAVTNAELSPVIEYVVPTPVVFHTAPAPCRKSVEHEHIWKRRKKTSDDATHLFFSV